MGYGAARRVAGATHRATPIRLRLRLKLDAAVLRRRGWAPGELRLEIQDIQDRVLLVASGFPLSLCLCLCFCLCFRCLSVAIALDPGSLMQLSLPAAPPVRGSRSPCAVQRSASSVTVHRPLFTFTVAIAVEPVKGRAGAGAGPGASASPSDRSSMQAPAPASTRNQHQH